MQDFRAASASAQVAQRELRMRRVERDDGGQARRRYGGGHPFRRVRAGVPAGRTTSRSTLFSVAHPGEGGTTSIGHYRPDRDAPPAQRGGGKRHARDRKSKRLNSSH